MHFAGDLSGSASFDGSADASIVATCSTADQLRTARTISLSGDVAGSVTFDGTADASIAATIQPNSVALGADTTGDFVATIASGAGLSASGAGEAAAASVELNPYMQGFSVAETSVGGDPAAPLGEYFPLAVKSAPGVISVRHASVPAVIQGNMAFIDHQEPLVKHSTGTGNLTLGGFPDMLFCRTSPQLAL